MMILNTMSNINTYKTWWYFTHFSVIHFVCIIITVFFNVYETSVFFASMKTSYTIRLDWIYLFLRTFPEAFQKGDNSWRMKIKGKTGQNMRKKNLFKKKVFSIWLIFPDIFIINIQEDPRNNRSIKSGLSGNHQYK